MFEELKTLVELQTIDSKLLAVEKELAVIPIKEKQLKDDLAAEEELVTGQRQTAKDQEKEQRAAEMDMKSAENAINKYQSQLTACKTNKEYTTMQHEIMLAKEKISVIEEKILHLMDKLEEGHKLLAEEEKVFAQKKKNFDEKTAEINVCAEEKNKEKEALQKTRLEIAKELSADTRLKYDKIAKIRNNLAVAGITESTCKGCYNELPPQMINDIMQNDRINNCQACGRILYWEEGLFATTNQRKE